MERGGITPTPSRRCRCVELMLKCLLDCATQFNPRLIDGSKAIPLFEGPDVQAGREKEVDCIVYDLVVRVWIVSNDCDPSANFDAAE